MITHEDIIKAWGTALLEIFELLFSLKVTLSTPSAIGTIAVLTVVALTYVFHVISIGNPYVQQHKKASEGLFTVSNTVSILIMIFLLIKVSPL